MRDQPRLHVALEAPLAAGAALEMSPAQAHYLGHVLRHGQGRQVRLFNARDGEWLAQIDRLPRHGHGRFSVVSRLRPAVAETGPILLFAPVKRDATDLIVRAATELGARALWPVLTERTIAARVRVDRLAAIAIEAAEQCERLSVPAVAEPRPLSSVLSEWPTGHVLCAAIERGAVCMGGRQAASADAVLIGPEGGFTPAELDALLSRPFVTPVSLGARLLRAETAAIAALACLQQARERWAFTCDQPPSGGGQQIPHPRATPAEPDVEPS